jgi:hypothetical protein
MHTPIRIQEEEVDTTQYYTDAILPDNREISPVIFTRYLYEKTEVLHSLLFALLDHCREEALFWAYELYYSGFIPELAGWIRWMCTVFYSKVDKWFQITMELELSRLDTLPDENERDCLIGTIISNLAHREYDIQHFAKDYMRFEFTETDVPVRNHLVYIRFRPRDLSPYKPYVTSGDNPNDHLKTFSRYPIRKNASLFLRKYVQAAHESAFVADTTEPYLYNWLYYALQCPYWNECISKYSVVDHDKKIVSFLSDDHAEEFYSTYGYYPEELSYETHIIHGVDIHTPSRFAAICPFEFIAVYSKSQIQPHSVINPSVDRS